MDVVASQNNFVGGELSPKMRGRYNLPVYGTGGERFVNWIPELQGPARYRNGTQFVLPTRRNKVACYIPFQFNDSQSYLLEFTDHYFRILRNNGILVEADKTITNIVAGTVTSAGHGYSTGDEIFIFDVVGVSGLNGKNFLVVKTGTDTFTLTDVDGNPVTGSGSYVSGGVCQRIVEVKTPYWEADLFDLKYAQNADTAYINHRYYEKRKLVRSSATSWSLATYTRTADPFLSKKVITDITKAAQAVITSAGHGYSNGDLIIIDGVVGMTEINGNFGVLTVSDKTTDTFKVKDRNGTYVNSSSFTTYTSGGYASSQLLLPSVCWFYESRMLDGCTDAQPSTLWGTRSPTTAGVARYDDYTTGTDADHAFVFTIAPSSGKVEKIQWFAATTRYFAIGTFGGVSKANGGDDNTAISPTSINVRPAVINGGGASSVLPIPLGQALLYMQRTGRVMIDLQYDLLYDAFIPTDKNLIADHITISGIKQMVFQNSRPESIWLVRNDGVLLQVVYKQKENVAGWARHILGGTDVKVISAGVVPRDNDFDQVWVVVERTINGVTRRYNEYFNDPIEFPEKDDFFTGINNEETDNLTWRRAMAEAQKMSIHVDSALTYDGSIQDVTMTPGAITGDDISFTASGNLFSAGDVGREIRKKAINGVGYGRAKIVTYVSPTEVECQITVDFDSVDAMAAGDWYLTTAKLTGLDHLEGELIAIAAEGGYYGTETVSGGEIELAYQVSVAHAGFANRGILKTMNWEMPGANGPTSAKPKNINKLGLRLLNTLGLMYGTSLYRLQEILVNSAQDLTNYPPPLWSGSTEPLSVEDETDTEKHLYFVQEKPLPATILNMDPFFDVNDN